MKIYINDTLLKQRRKYNNIYIYYLENGTKLKTKEIDFFEIICDKCNKSKKILNYPTTNSNIYLCGTCRQLGEKNPCYGRKHTEEWKKQKSTQNKGKNNPMYNKSVYDVWVEKYGEDIAN